MEPREKRRANTYRHARRQLELRIRICNDSSKTLGRFAKWSAIGCNCKRRFPGHSPKIAASLCHGGGYGYHPCVVERIEGKRLEKAWLRELRGNEPDDIDL